MYNGADSLNRASYEFAGFPNQFLIITMVKRNDVLCSLRLFLICSPSQYCQKAHISLFANLFVHLEKFVFALK